MVGSLMMFASGVWARAPSSARASPTCGSSGRRSLNCASTRAASEMSLVSTSTPAEVAKASMIGLSEYVARSGASSVRVYMIFAIVMYHSASSWGLSPTSYLPDDFGSRHGPMMVLTPGIRAGWTGGEGSGGGGGGRSPWRSWSGAESAVVFCVGTDNRKRMTVAKLYFRYGAMNSGKSTALL